MAAKKPITGREVIDFIIKNNLVHVAGQRAAVFVWSANAIGQLDGLLRSGK